ncbi:MAG: PAS domain-containing protein, partial [Lactobacillus sp.]|nr:PAS domain-containing protein [Lactobacillus sp.]
FQEGRLNLQQLQAIMGMLPFALTFIDADDRVAYFGGGAEIYPHSQNALGNKVFLCHQAQARPLIKKIFRQFHTGEKDKYEFWFKLHKTERYLYLRYYAVHDDNGKYLGCLEVAQDVTEIRAWTNEQKTI